MKEIDTIHEIIESSFEYVGQAGGFDIAVGNIIATIDPDVSVDEAVAKTLQYLNAELDKKDAEIQRLTAHDDAIRREAFESGYVQGENDAVEGRVRNYKDAAEDYIRYSILGTEPKGGKR